MQLATKIFIAVILAAIAVYDIFAAIYGGHTISAQVWQWSASYPVLPFTIGFLMGHLFFHSSS